jgi:hypothetical protein
VDRGRRRRREGARTHTQQLTTRSSKRSGKEERLCRSARRRLARTEERLTNLRLVDEDALVEELALPVYYVIGGTHHAWWRSV